MAAPLIVSEPGSQRKRMTSAICAGVTHRAWSACGCARRLAGVSITLGSTALLRTPSSRVLHGHGLGKRDHRRLGGDVAGGAGERLHGGARGDAHHRAPRLAQARQRGVGDQVGGPEVHRQLALEVLQRRLVHARPAAVAADKVHDGAQRRPAVAGRDLDRRRIGHVGPHDLGAVEILLPASARAPPGTLPR